MTFPLSTLAAQITSTGISAPSYADILASLQASFQSIYGSDAYITPDSQDGQLLAVFAQAINDANNTLIAVYNSFSPTYAQGAGLSSVVKINGLQRNISTFSTADGLVVGSAGTVITDGVVKDINGNLWDLPSSVTIPVSGQITVTVTAQDAGAVVASAGTIDTINTPTYGWQSFASTTDATAGAPVETDAQLRVRQASSTAIPSQTVMGGIVGAVGNIPGVTQLISYENDTNSTDANTLPAHSISLVVLGGDAIEIATTIAEKKTPGTYTYGTTTEVIVDALTGLPVTINFFRPTIHNIYLLVNLTALVGYAATTGTAIIAALVDYIQALAIGGDVYNSKLIGVADDVALSDSFNLTSLYAARDDMQVTGGPYAAGLGTISVVSAANISTGKAIGITLDNSTILYATVTGVAGIAVTFTPVIPGGRSVQNAVIVYVRGDLLIGFNELAETDTTKITLTAT